MKNTTNDSPAIDLPKDRRPGVPAEQDPLAPMGSAHWLTPERQIPCPGVTVDAQRGESTATFGTGQPPRGLSGMMRTTAYRIPDYDPKRWALLLLADRVDAFEDRLLSIPQRPSAWLGLAAWVGILVVKRRQRHGRRGSLLARVFS